MCFQIELFRSNHFSKELDNWICLFLLLAENTEEAIVPDICRSDLRLISDPKVHLETLHFQPLLPLK